MIQEYLLYSGKEIQKISQKFHLTTFSDMMEE
jgi:hypothetical protein